MGVEQANQIDKVKERKEIRGASFASVRQPRGSSQLAVSSRTQISDFVHLCCDRAFKREFQKKDYEAFLDHFELAIEQGTWIRLADEREVVKWRPDLVEHLGASLEEHMACFESEYSVCKMIILKDVSEDHDGLWFYSVGRQKNAAYVWRPEGWN